jgi:hypothetical protein
MFVLLYFRLRYSGGQVGGKAGGCPISNVRRDVERHLILPNGDILPVP